MKTIKPKSRAIALFIYLLFSIQLISQESQEASSADALAQKLQNPVSDLISVPFQGNFDFGIGPDDGTRITTNIQPVIPLSISEDWNLIARVILPVVYQNDVFVDSGNQFGLGDIVASGFFSPKEPSSGGIIWGVGPVLLIPTGTDQLLSSKKFGLGPTAVILKQAGSITVGALANHIWSVVGESDRTDVNATFLQPFVAKNFDGGYALALNTELTQNWESDSTIGFFHLVGSKVVPIGSQLTQVFIGPRIPYGGGNTTDWGFRAGITLLFPK